MAGVGRLLTKLLTWPAKATMKLKSVSVAVAAVRLCGVELPHSDGVAANGQLVAQLRQW